MPQFAYEAQDIQGRIVAGLLQCATSRDAVRRLNEQQLLPLSVIEKQQGVSLQSRVSNRQLIKFYQMLADLIDSGMPLLKSLELLVQQASHQGLQSLLSDITTQVADGKPLAKAMSEHPKVFDELTVSMVRAGEEGGFLEESLQRISQLNEQRSQLLNNLRGALAYPAFLLVVGTIIVIGMLTFFVPKFEPLFERLRATGELPMSTTTLLAVSGWMRVYGLWCMIGGAALLPMMIRWYQTPIVRLRMDRWKLRLRILGPLLASASLAIYCRVLGTLLRNGVPLLDSLRIAKSTARNLALQHVVQRAAERVSAGASLAENLNHDAIIPVEIIEMIRIGEKSNRLDAVLLKIADQLDQRLQQQLTTVSKLVEPSLMVVMAIVIGFLMLALLMPVFLSSGRFG